MKAYGNRGYRGNPEYEPYGMPEDDDEFEMNEQWHEADFDENVSHASSRAHQTMVDSHKSAKGRSQPNRPTDSQRESSVRGASPNRISMANYNYRVANNPPVQEDTYQGEGVYEDDEYLVVDQEEVIVEEDNDIDIDAENEHDPESEKDFHNAYNQLVERLHQEQGNDLLLNPGEWEEAQKRKELRKQMKERTDERIKNFQENKRRKMELIKQENEK